MNQPKPTATVGPLPCPAGGFFAAANVDKPIRMTRSSPQRSSFSGATASELQQYADKLRIEKLLLKQRKASKNAQPQPRQSSAAAMAAAVSASESRPMGFNGAAPGSANPAEPASVARPQSAGPGPGAGGQIFFEGPLPKLPDSTSSSTDTPVSPRGLNVNAPIFVPSAQSAFSTRKTSVSSTTTILPPAGRPMLVGINTQTSRRSSLQETGRSLTDVGPTSKDSPSGALIGQDGGGDNNNNMPNSKNLISALSSLKIGDGVGPLATSGETNGQILPPLNAPRNLASLASLNVNNNTAGDHPESSFLLACSLSAGSIDLNLKERDTDGQCSNLASGSASPADDLSVLDDEDEQAVLGISIQEPVKKLYDRVDILRIYAQNKGTFPRPVCLSHEFDNASGVFDPSKWIQHIWAYEQANGISYGTRLTKLPWLSMSSSGSVSGSGGGGSGGFINREDVPKNAQPPMQLLLQQHKKP